MIEMNHGINKMKKNEMKNGMNMGGKQGQITLFIILGIVLLFSAGIYTYITMSDDDGATFIPDKRTPIEKYVYDCIDDVSKDAILQLGNQGGYVKMPEEILGNTPSYVSLDPNFYSIIPYWYYGGKTKIPSIDSMEAGISEYVEENLAACLDNFTGFENQYRITVLGAISASAKIGDDAIIVDVKYPFEAYDYKSEKKTFDKFTSSFNVKLKRAHALATEIMNYENERAFFENITVDLMALDSDIPFSGLDFSCDKKSWQIADIRSRAQDLIRTYFPRIRFMNAKHMPFQNPEKDYGSKKNLADSYEYFHLAVLPSKNSYNDLFATAAYYPELGLDLAARPSSKQGTLESSRGKGQDLLSYMCVQLYHFTYDLYFPAIVMIRDDSAFNREGFVFRFATPVMIDHNMANRKNVGFTEMNLPTRYDSDFCAKRSDDLVDISAKGSDGTYFGVELNDVNISYRCINIECPLGMTSNIDGAYKLKTALPSGCGYGTVIARKNGYIDSEKRLTDEVPFEIELTGLKRLKVSFREQAEKSLGQDKELADDETVVFRLSSSGFNYEKNGYFDRKGNYTIELIGDDATYSLDATLMKDDKIIGGFKGNLTIKYADLENAREVSFGVVRKSMMPILDSEKLELVMYLEGNSYQGSLQPVFK